MVYGSQLFNQGKAHTSTLTNRSWNLIIAVEYLTEVFRCNSTTCIFYTNQGAGTQTLLFILEIDFDTARGGIFAGVREEVIQNQLYNFCIKNSFNVFLFDFARNPEVAVCIGFTVFLNNMLYQFA
ncbi:hypothetical protein D3C85_1025400 [compost metagenome]